MKTLAITPNFVKMLEAKTNSTSKTADPRNDILANFNVGNFLVNVVGQNLKLYLSVSQSSGLTMLAIAASGALTASVDLATNIRDGHITRVKAETFILEACIKDVTENRVERQLVSSGASSGAAKHDISFRTTVNANFIQ